MDVKRGMRNDFVVSRQALNGLLNILNQETDHGWGHHLEILISVFWLAHGLSYGVMAQAFDVPNYKQFHSIQLQGICDSFGRFLDIFVDYRGSVHDTRNLRNSTVYFNSLY